MHTGHDPFEILHTYYVPARLGDGAIVACQWRCGGRRYGLLAPVVDGDLWVRGHYVPGDTPLGVLDHLATFTAAAVQVHRRAPDVGA